MLEMCIRDRVMTKQEIFEKLEELNLDKSKYIIIGGASLVYDRSGQKP